MVMSDPILIWGAGAVGGSLGAAFVRAGEEVVFVDTAADHWRRSTREASRSRVRSPRITFGAGRFCRRTSSAFIGAASWL